MIKGIDISKHQGKVDFAKVADFGVRFVYVKATEGTGYIDPMFYENVDGARTAGLYVGAYHFARPDSVGTVRDAEAEAKGFCGAMARAGLTDPGHLPPALDLEKYSDNGPRESREWVQEFMRVLKARGYRTPVIYTGRNWWKYEMGNSDAFTHHPLWLVRYARTAAALERHTQKTRSQSGMPWERWTFRQWSGGGKFNYHGPVPGVQGACDVNWFNGTEEDLAALCGAPAKPENPERDAYVRIAEFHEEMAREMREKAANV